MKIFFEDRIIRLVDKKIENKFINDFQLVDINNQHELKKWVNDFLSNKSIKEIHFFYQNLTELKKWFFDCFTIIEAAGGLVMNDKAEFLFIFRKGKWDLPKGKIETDESINVAAIREVEEECGINNITILKQLPDTYHVYWLNNQLILKPTYWFLMKTSFIEKLIPQTEEGITKVEWVKKENINELMKNAYESIKEVMGSFEKNQ